MVGRHESSTTRRPLDPMAFPGIRSASSVGLGARSGSLDVNDVAQAASVQARRSQTWRPDGASTFLGRRLLASRQREPTALRPRHRDAGSPALLDLVKSSELALNHFDLDRLGVETGDVVSVVGAKGSTTLPVRLDNGVPRGTVGGAFATLSGDGDSVLGIFVDASSVINQVE